MISGAAELSPCALRSSILPLCAAAYCCAPVSPVPVRCTPFLCSKTGPLRVITRVSVHALAFVADVDGHGRRMLVGAGNNVYAWLGLRLHGTDQELRRHCADLIRAGAGGLDRVLKLQADRRFFCGPGVISRSCATTC